jgi:hypothetical protein
MTTIKDVNVDSVKENAIIMFSEDLKTEMMKVASTGMNNGSMYLVPDKYSELGKILSLSDTKSIYDWILEQFKERKMFDDIDFVISKDIYSKDCDLQFCWYSAKIVF